ncbi:alpha/beta fold hydrolase [Dyella silvatica]|uniref:alpha/beta fold hydrolase n=1 Tax=Dyella silvatica TaxID=2992128 RepID=UPI00225B43A3|nr:alpha/beta fold hydrolase [Dyella silvatica]
MTAYFKSATAARDVHERYRALLSRWPVANTQLRVTTRVGDTFVVASGDPAAPPLALLHGSLSNAAAWMFDAAVWSKHFRVYAIDMIGEAGLSAPVRPALNSDTYAAWISDVLDHLGVVQAAFVGASLGGWLALDFASRHPARVTQLALLYPSGIGRQRAFWWKAAPLLLLGEWGRQRVRQRVLGSMPKILSGDARSLLDLLDSISRRFKPRRESIPVLSDTALRRLTMPVLVIVGGKDALLDTEETQRRVIANLPHAVVRLLPQAPHYVQGQTEPVLRFLLASSGVSND